MNVYFCELKALVMWSKTMISSHLLSHPVFMPHHLLPPLCLDPAELSSQRIVLRGPQNQGHTDPPACNSTKDHFQQAVTHIESWNRMFNRSVYSCYRQHANITHV